MKKITNIILPVMLLALVACSISDSPKKAASKFLNAFNEKDYEEARKYSTPETIKLVDLMESLGKMSTTIDSTAAGKIEVIDEHISGDTARVTFREKGMDETSELMLKKVEGKWLVHITKTDVAAKENSVFDTEEGLMESDSIQFDADSMEAIESAPDAD